jgi:uncharacterized repeat protein (TIGR01451 family)
LTIAAGEQIVFTIKAKTTPTSFAGTFKNFATLSNIPVGYDTNATNDVGSAPVQSFYNNADICVTKALTVPAGGTATVGATLVTYVITVRNDGTDDANGISVTDSFASILDATWTCTPGAGATCNAPTTGMSDIATTVDLDNNAQATFTITGYVIGSTTASSFINSVNVSHTNTFHVDSNLLNNNYSANVLNIVPSADLSVSKAMMTAAPFVPGSTTVTYQITVKNNGPPSVTGISVLDSVGANLTSVSWTCSPNPACPASSPTDISTNLVSLASGASLTFTLMGSIPSNLTGTLTNIVTISHTNDNSTANNVASVFNPLTPSVNVAVTKTTTTGSS